MAANLKGTVTIKDGKIVRVHKFAAGQRKAKIAKASRDVKKWRAKSK